MEEIPRARDNVMSVTYDKTYDKRTVTVDDCEKNWFLALFLSLQTPSHNNRTADNVHQNYCCPRPRGPEGWPNVWA